MQLQIKKAKCFKCTQMRSSISIFFYEGTRQFYIKCLHCMWYYRFKCRI